MIENKQDLTQILGQIAQSLQQIAMAMTPSSAICKPIGEYLTFDWSSIGARVLKEDEDGPSLIECQGQVWKRRAPDNQYSAAIWFSRCIGKDPATGNNKYESLIYFEEINQDVQPLGRKVKRLVDASRRERRPQPSAPSQSKTQSRPVPVATKTEPIEETEPEDEYEAAAAHEQAHRGIEAELKQFYLDSGRSEAEWSVYYNKHDLADKPLVEKRRLLANWREQVRDQKRTPEKAALDLQAPTLSPNQQAIKDQIGQLEVLGVKKEGDAGWPVRMARLAGGICEVEGLDPAAAAKVRASFANWLKELRSGSNVRPLKRPA